MAFFELLYELDTTRILFLNSAHTFAESHFSLIRISYHRQVVIFFYDKD